MLRNHLFLTLLVLAMVTVVACGGKSKAEQAVESVAQGLTAQNEGRVDDAAKAYRAACTPDFFVYDKDRKLAYRGQMDASRPGNGKPNDGADLRAALNAVLAGKPVEGQQWPSIGCNIKWKS